MKLRFEMSISAWQAMRILDGSDRFIKGIDTKICNVFKSIQRFFRDIPSNIDKIKFTKNDPKIVELFTFAYDFNVFIEAKKHLIRNCYMIRISMEESCY